MSDFTETALTRVVRKHALAVEGLTEAQFVEALRQALLSGDFQRLVVAPPRVDWADPWNGRVYLTQTEPSASLRMSLRQTVIYHPYAETERLRGKLHEARRMIERLTAPRDRMTATEAAELAEDARNCLRSGLYTEDGL